MKRIVLYLAVVVALLALVCAVVFFVRIGMMLIIWSGDCQNEVLQEIVSRDGRLKAVVFHRECGTLGGDYFDVSVLPARAKLPGDFGNVYHGETSVTVEWLGATQLQVTHPELRAKVFIQKDRIRFFRPFALVSVTHVPGQWRGETWLHQAAQGGSDGETTARLLAEGLSVTATNDGGETPLHIAAAQPLPEVAKVLLAHGADVHARDNKGWTALHNARTVAMVQLLLNHGADANAVGSDKITPLRMATGTTWDNETLRILIEHGADVNAHNEEGSTALHVAAGRGDADRAAILLAYGADIETVDGDGNTPLHESAEKGAVEVTILLLAEGANLCARNNQDNTPLHIAVREAHTHVVEALVAGGADVNETENGNTPLHIAAGFGHLDLVNWLLEHHADVNARSPSGMTPLVWAVAQDNNEEVAWALLDHGADVNARDNKGHTPLHMAVFKHQTDAAEVLREHGATE